MNNVNRLVLKEVIMNLKKRKYLFIFLIFSLTLLLFVSISFAKTEPIEKVTIYSEKSNYQSGEPSSWKIEKSAKWVNKGEAEVVFDVFTEIQTAKDFNDIILVLDTSNTMETLDDSKVSRLDTVKKHTIELINTIFKNKGNKMALISFNDEANILSYFTDNKEEIITNLNDLTTYGGTNYYAALKNVSDVMQNYKYDENRNCIVLFLTDGVPNLYSPAEEGQYKYLKDTYPFLEINAVQYEMGEEISDKIKKISDRQFVGFSDSLFNVLYEASVLQLPYEEFVVEDYINVNNFYVENENDILTKFGKVTFDKDNQKIVWDLSGLYSGSTSAQLKIKLKLKDELIGQGGIYETNSHEIIRSVIKGKTENVDSDLTPILADNYMVKYDINAPSDCDVQGKIPENRTYSVLDMVEIAQSKSLSCGNYKFAGWEIMENDVTKIGDYFIMPEKNVNLKAKWKKIKIIKKMEGKVYTLQHLYDMIKDNKKFDDKNLTYKTKDDWDIIDTNHSGIYEMLATAEDKYPIYFYRGTNNDTKNNLLFAGACWKIVRTTNTGGVKIVYNGLPNESLECNNTGLDATIGTGAFNSEYESLSSVGYMYGDFYPNELKSMIWYEILGKSLRYDYNISNTNYYYSKNVTYNSETNTYTLVNPTTHLWEQDYNNLSGYYTCKLETKDGCSDLIYVEPYNTKQTSTKMNYILMNNGETYESWYEYYNNHKWKYGNDVIWNGSTYNLTGEIIEINPFDWYNNDNNARTNVSNMHHYTCFSDNNSCNPISYIHYAGSRMTGYAMNVKIKDGKSLEGIIEEMTTKSTNTVSSTIKEKIDRWFESNILSTDYEGMLEDTVWCNDRTINFKNGWDKNKDAANYLYFLTDTVNYIPKEKLMCSNLVDKFTVNNTLGNGKLTYPIGLLTGDEITLSGSGGYYNYNINSYLNIGYDQWTLTPKGYNENYAYNYVLSSDGYLDYDYYPVYYNEAVRPAVSLAYDVIVSGGDGSISHPFTVDDLRAIHVIKVNDENVMASKTEAKAGTKIFLTSKVEDKIIKSFKLNGKVVEGDNFIMSDEDVTISDVVLENSNYKIIETNHYPYDTNLDQEWNVSFEGATSLTIELEYQIRIMAENAFIDYLSINGKSYGSNTLKKETIIIEGNSVRLFFHSGGNGNNFYGFKATITANF